MFDFGLGGGGAAAAPEGAGAEGLAPFALGVIDCACGELAPKIDDSGSSNTAPDAVVGGAEDFGFAAAEFVFAVSFGLRTVTDADGAVPFPFAFPFAVGDDAAAGEGVIRKLV